MILDGIRSLKKKRFIDDLQSPKVSERPGGYPLSPWQISQSSSIDYINYTERSKDTLAKK